MIICHLISDGHNLHRQLSLPKIPQQNDIVASSSDHKSD